MVPLLRMLRMQMVLAMLLAMALVVMLVAMAPSPVAVAASSPWLRRARVTDDDTTTTTTTTHNEDDGFTDTAITAAMNADCQLRTLVLTTIGIIEPIGANANWTAAAYDALQLGPLCASVQPQPQPEPQRPPIKATENRRRVVPLDLNATCDATFYVAATNSSDSNPGTIDAPFATLAHALDATRAARALQHVVSPCIVLRAGTYYLGEQLPSTAGSPKDSQFGAIDLQPFDSNLTIAAYSGETVVLSAGARITPQWQFYAHGPAGGTIYQTKLVPTNPAVAQVLTDAFHFNELFVGGQRAVRAKWPNGDPSTHGLFSSDTGYDQSDSVGWLAPFPSNASVEVHITDPFVANDYFPTYQMGIGGPADVYDPPRSFWATANPPGGGGATFIVPSGMNLSSFDGLVARAANWSNPSTGFAHVFHSGGWANWIFALDTFSTTDQLLHFSEGGFQDARGSSTGGAFYFEYLLEELDAPLEWFYNRTTGVLYFMPNSTTLPTELVVSQLPCLISAHGTADTPVANVVLAGLTFSHTPNTMMRKFEVPSGGDWSLHRGGAVFLTGTSYSTIQQSTFSYLGGTGVVVSDWNLGTAVTTSEFVWGCDSGVVVLGSIVGIDSVTYTNQPTLVRVTDNLFHELGIYIKQSAPVLISLSRSITVSGNVMFNVPRAAININDPFHGNHTLHGNVIFNAVRETVDHGPINTWDRLPLLTLQVNATTGETYESLDPAVTHITRNLIFNSYQSLWPIDHDDGSRMYEDAYNVFVYGGYKNYLGNSKVAHNTLYIYPDGQRFDEISPWLAELEVRSGRRVEAPLAAAAADETDGSSSSEPEAAVKEGRGRRLRIQYGAGWGAQCMQAWGPSWGAQCVQSWDPNFNLCGWNEHWLNNTCVMWQSAQPYEFDGCQIGDLDNVIPFLSNNRLYFPQGMSAQIPCSYANGTGVTLSLADLQALGYDAGTTQGVAPSTSELVQMAYSLLFGV